jgi:hypothetical protein
MHCSVTSSLPTAPTLSMLSTLTASDSALVKLLEISEELGKAMGGEEYAGKKTVPNEGLPGYEELNEKRVAGERYKS